MSLRADLRRLYRDRRGNFVLIFALMMIPLVGLLGLSVDYAFMNKMKEQLDATNDAAVLAAATAASQTVQAETTTSSNATTVDNDAATAAQSAYSSFFASDAARTGALSLNYTNPSGTTNPSISINGLIIKVTGIYTAQSNNIFGKLFGIPAFNVAGISTSSVTLPKYVNIYIVADVSMSEGLGATTGDMTSLQSLTQSREDAPATGCQFGCHVITKGYSDSSNFEDTAHNYTGPNSTNTNNNTVAARGLTLRIDSMRNAVMDIITKASQSPAGFNGTPRVQLAVYTMDLNVNKVATLSSNYSQLMTTVEPPSFPNNSVTNLGPIDMSSSSSYVYPTSGTEDGMSYQGSLLSLNSGSFAGSLPANGDGSSPSAPVNYVFLMTDGVYDINASNSNSAPDGGACGAYMWNHCTGAMTAKDCAGFQGKATVDIIYTQYLPNPTESRYQALVQQFQLQASNPNYDGVQVGLNACAAAGDPGGQVILAASGTDIENAATQLFNQVVLAERLTE